MDRLVPSRYNFQAPFESGIVLYNANTGAVLRLEGADGRVLGELLTAPPAPFGVVLPDSVFHLLTGGGFLVPESTDEVETVRKRYWQAREETPLVLTITTTQDCNLGCYYCYEERSKDQLESADVDKLVEFARSRLTRQARRSLHVDWYGGEPFLNVRFLEQASLALQSLCRELSVIYHASVISNGTSWPQDPAGFARTHALRQVQISFDGMRERHNKSRRYRKGYGSPGDSSFDQAIQVVDALLDATRVDIRLNISRQNHNDVLPFLKMARARGWFRKPFPAVIQPARLAAFTGHCGFLRPGELTLDEFEDIRNQVRTALAGEALVEETEAPDGLPLPKTSVCAALSRSSAVIGADGLEYRCGLQVGQASQATGRVRSSAAPFQILPAEDHAAQRDWWEAFDPTKLPTCSKCSFLPICLGGCAHKHLQSDRHALDEQGAYWRTNLPRLMANRAGVPIDKNFRFTEADQYRLGV